MGQGKFAAEFNGYRNRRDFFMDYNEQFNQSVQQGLDYIKENKVVTLSFDVPQSALINANDKVCLFAPSWMMAEPQDDVAKGLKKALYVEGGSNTCGTIGSALRTTFYKALDLGYCMHYSDISEDEAERRLYATTPRGQILIIPRPTTLELISAPPERKPETFLNTLRGMLHLRK
jgi:hypothetical protein